MGKNKQKKKKWDDQSKEVQIWVKVGSRKGAKKKEKKYGGGGYSRYQIEDNVPELKSVSPG